MKKKASWDSSRWGWVLTLILTALSVVIAQANKLAVMQEQLLNSGRDMTRLYERIDRIEKPCK